MINKILHIAQFSFFEGIRHKVIYGIFTFGVIMAGATCFFTTFIGFDVCKVVIDLMLGTVSAGCLMVIFFLCMPGLINDIKEQTIYFILSSPVKRSEYIIGKFLGYSMLLFVCMLILSVPALVIVKIYMVKYTAYIPTYFAWNKLIIACFLKFYSAFVFLSLIFLLWNIMSTGFLVSMTGILVYIISQNISMVKNITMASKNMNIFSQKLIVFISWIFPNLAYFNLNTYAAYGVSLPNFYITKILIYGFSYIVAAIIISVFLFNRREL